MSCRSKDPGQRKRETNRERENLIDKNLTIRQTDTDPKAFIEVVPRLKSV